MNTHELAWAAGFIDGEGYFHFNPKRTQRKQRAYGALALTVAQSEANVQILHRLRSAFNGLGCILGPYKHKKSNQKPYFVYSSARFEHTQAIIAMVWKYLDVKRRTQAKSALLMCLEFARRPPLPKGPAKKVHTL